MIGIYPLKSFKMLSNWSSANWNQQTTKGSSHVPLHIFWLGLAIFFFQHKWLLSKWNETVNVRDSIWFSEHQNSFWAQNRFNFSLIFFLLFSISSFRSDDLETTSSFYALRVRHRRKGTMSMKKETIFYVFGVWPCTWALPRLSILFPWICVFVFSWCYRDYAVSRSFAKAFWKYAFLQKKGAWLFVECEWFG